MTHLLQKDGRTACGLRVDLFLPQSGSGVSFDGDHGQQSFKCTIETARATCLHCHGRWLAENRKPSKGYHFKLALPLHIDPDHTVRAVFDHGTEGDPLTGLEIITTDHGHKIASTRVAGEVLDGPMIDPRSRLPITIDGVALYRGY